MRLVSLLFYVASLLTVSCSMRTSPMRMSLVDGGRNLNIDVPDGQIFYDLFRSKDQPQTSTPILYLPSLNSPKNEAKSNNLQAWCRRNDLTFLCGDYFGLGRSSGKFEDGTVGRWATDTIALMEEVFTGNLEKTVLVGHGVGTWISFVIAQKRPDLVAGIVGMAADPDFTEELLWKTLPEDTKNKIMNDGVANIHWGNAEYPISKKLIEDGRENLLLKQPIPVYCPVRLIHSIEDEEVPFELALKLANNCMGTDASVTLIKGSIHTMESEKDMRTMRSNIVEVIEAYNEGGFDLKSPGSG